MVDDDALLTAFESCAGVLLGPFDVGDVLYQLTDQVVDVLGVDGAGLSVARDGQTLAFVAATDTAVASIEVQQEIGGQGPCHEAYQTGDQVVVDDLDETDADRWGSYRSVALAQGCRAVAGIPMPAGERRIGAVNLYRHEPHVWSDGELRVAQLLANIATGYVLNQTSLSGSRTLAGQLQHALDSRVLIEQAKGVLAGRAGIAPSEAFTLMRSHSGNTDTSLHALAQGVIDGTADMPMPVD